MHDAVLDSYMIEHNNLKELYLLDKGGYFLVALVCLSVCLFGWLVGWLVVCGHHSKKGMNGLE